MIYLFKFVAIFAFGILTASFSIDPVIILVVLGVSFAGGGLSFLLKSVFSDDSVEKMPSIDGVTLFSVVIDFIIVVVTVIYLYGKDIQVSTLDAAVLSSIISASVSFVVLSISVQERTLSIRKKEDL